MDEASRLLFHPDPTRREGDDAIQLPRMTLHFALEPRAMMTWHARSHTEIRVLSARASGLRVRSASTITG
ncbi:Uncharacterised protein [Burkholderia pseudomallei]|nr:Uncharacterised protein [Burkholderia pseudomallei]CAJ3924526.1 Uncharacterised protein [Burkholderia pseudomallei]CAJ4529192.1 Uncharacterised protein [Burkholderia pseudomallei]CAJ5321808.1 Uncharacterised protein [Burkholderia pseudomallei]CAJ5453335.1 Uncharacterised protein [Burkholderia pseudomallei]